MWALMSAGPAGHPLDATGSALPSRDSSALFRCCHRIRPRRGAKLPELGTGWQGYGSGLRSVAPAGRRRARTRGRPNSPAGAKGRNGPGNECPRHHVSLGRPGTLTICHPGRDGMRCALPREVTGESVLSWRFRVPPGTEGRDYEFSTVSRPDTGGEPRGVGALPGSCRRLDRAGGQAKWTDRGGPLFQQGVATPEATDRVDGGVTWGRVARAR